MKYSSGVVLCALMFFALQFAQPVICMAQENEDKGDLEDFTEDYDDEGDKSGDSGDSDDTEFFLWVVFNSIDEFSRLWGRTPDTRFGYFPSYPYSDGIGFKAATDDYRSYYFNTEFSYQVLNEDLRSYNLKWETQFIHRSKLSFDLSVYEEDVRTEYGFPNKDHLTFYGFRYGYAVFSTQQVITNVELGYRGLHRNRTYGGPEIALDMTVFPGKPLIIETEFAAAYIRNGPLYTAEASAGFAIGRVELLGGIRVLKNKDSDLLDGFRFGLRLWY